MLLPFHDFTKLKTRRVVFEEHYHARDSPTLEALKDLSSLRRAIEDSINGSRFIPPAIAREMASGETSPIVQDLQKLERYLPPLENLVKWVSAENESQEMAKWTANLRLRWTSTLAGSSGYGLTGHKFFRIDDLRYELCMMLFLYGALLREKATSMLPLDMVNSATILRKAAGVFHHIAHNLLPGLITKLPNDRPPEVTPSMAAIMHLICLAEAQAVAVCKAQEKSSSNSLLSKLHFGIVQILEEAKSYLQQYAADWNDVSDKFKGFLHATTLLHEVRSWRHLAEHFKGIDNVGQAISILRHVLNKVEHKKVIYDDEAKLVFKQEINIITEMLRKYEKENEIVWRPRPGVPDDIPVLEGKRIASLIPYKPICFDREFMFVM